MLQNEIKRVKEDYAQCMEADKKETFERNKAETIAKTLKETIEVQEELKSQTNSEDMIIDDEVQVWKEQKTAKKKKKVMREDCQKLGFKCDECSYESQTKDKYNEHLLVHEQKVTQTDYNCNKCDKSYSSISKLRRHDWRSHREVECSISGENLES